MDFRSSTEFLTENPCRPAGSPAGRTTLPLLDFSCPTTQSWAGATCLGSGSLRCPVPRARFGYLLRGVYLQPSRRSRVGASMGFTLQGVPFIAIGPPLGGHALLPLPAASARLQGVMLHDAACFRALFLRRIRSVTGITSDPSRRSLPGVRPSRACSHSTWRSLCSRCLPSHPSTA